MKLLRCLGVVCSLLGCCVLAQGQTPVREATAAVEKAGRAAVRGSEMSAQVQRQTMRQLMRQTGAPYRFVPPDLEALKRATPQLILPPGGGVPDGAKPTTAASLNTPAQTPATPKPARYESPLLPFLLEEWELPDPLERPFSSSAIPSSYVDRSLASLRQECSALDILPQDWETYSRNELANLLFHYKALKSSAQVPSLFTPPADTPPEKPKELSVKEWAYQQPDFIPSNYVDDMEEEYVEPFTGPMTTLRILVVNDEWEEVQSLRVFAWQDGNVRLDYADNVSSAMLKLKNNHDGYDIVLLDHDMDGGNGTILSMWMHEQNISIPAVLLSREYMAPEWLYKYNIKGRIYVGEEPQAILNFARNIVTTGKAYSNGK